MSNRYYKGPVSDHFDGERFFNQDSRSADKSLFEVLRWSLSRKPAPWPKQIASQTGVKPAASVEGLRITLVGHASLLVQTAEVNLLVDPVWAQRASPFRWLGPKRVTPPAMGLDDLPPIHAVLVTHNHYDHMDTRTLRGLWLRYGAPMVMPLGNAGFVQKRRGRMAIETADWWQTVPLPGELKATLVPAYHWSSRRPGDFRKALWAGFYLHTPAGGVYLAGDTAYRSGQIYAEIGNRLGAPAVAVLPIGAYAPRDFMRANHCTPEEAVQMALDCGARAALGVHWKCFHLSDEPMDEPGQRFRAALAKAAVPGQALEPGDTWEPPA